MANSIGAVDYSTSIPNNVDLAGDRRVLRALERWHPNYLDWWKDMGPEGFQEALVYLRTAVSVDREGWATFDYVKMPDYRWGILLAPPGGRPHHPLRPAQGRAGLAGGSRANTARCCAASSSSRVIPSPPASSNSAIWGRPRRRSMTCATCFRSMWRKAGTSGRWSTCCRNTSAPMAERRPKTCCAAALATRIARACWAHSTSARRTG